jgi:hypothetical protein
MGYNQRRAVLLLYLVSAVLAALALVITVARSEVVLLAIGSLLIMAYVSVRVFGQVGMRDVLTKLSRDSTAKRHSAAARVTMGRVVSCMQDARDMDALWALCTEVFETLGLGRAELRLDVLPDSKEGLWTWKASPDEDGGQQTADDAAKGPDRWIGRLGLCDDDGLLGELVVENGASYGSMIPEAMELLDRLRAELAVQVGGLSRGNKRLSR